MTILDKITNSRKKQLAVLIDPDKITKTNLEIVTKQLQNNYADYVFVGGSLTTNSTDFLIKKLKEKIGIPIVLFPGNPLQISYKADAILFLSLISGRNPEYLIGHHVTVAGQLKHSNLEIIPTGYILIGTGNKISSVEYISNTKPIPAEKYDLAISTAIAGELLGMKLIYLEAGSGANNTISPEMISAVKTNTDIPLIVGGGIKNINHMLEYAQAGADIIVIGSLFEKYPEKLEKFYSKLKEI